MIKMKYKLISAAMVIAPLLSTGVVTTTVHANPINRDLNTRPGIIYNTNYSYTSFTTNLNSLVASGVINSYQESRILAVFNAEGNLTVGLDNLVASGVITSSQESILLSLSSGYSSSYGFDRFGIGANKGGINNNGGANKGGMTNNGGANKGGMTNNGGAAQGGAQGGARK